MPKISVVIPIYNVERYIERCAISLLSQTMEDIEYIFIDDCTPDRSIEILKDVVSRFPSRQDSVRIIKMSKNSRQAAVRKYGIQIAKGDYIIHCDSDDWVDVDLYEKMYDAAVFHSADVVFCPVVDEYANHSSLRTSQVFSDNGKDLVSNWYCTNIGMQTWSKLVRRTIFTENEIYPYEGINLWEDNGLMLRLFYYANKIVSIEGSAYHYNQANANAISVSYGRDGIDQMIACARKLDVFYSTKPDVVRFSKTVNAVKYLAKLNLITSRYDWLKEFKRTFPESDEALEYISLNAFSNKGTIRFMFVKYRMAWLFVTLFKIMNFIFRRKF